MSTIRRGNARLEVTVTIGSNAGTPGNWLHTLEFGSATNARITAGSESGTGNFTVSFPNGTRQVIFEVRRLQFGKDILVPFTAADDCGAWQTFAGDGATGS